MSQTLSGSSGGHIIGKSDTSGGHPVTDVQLLPIGIGNGPKEGRPVTRLLAQLRPHRALDAIGWTDINEINEATRRRFQLVPETIVITTNGIILSGTSSWHSAISEGREHISCTEYDLDKDECIQYILASHRTHSKWNSFVLVRLALTLEPYFQQKALDNMRTGGKCKGSTNLSKADRIEVRREIADAAGTGTGNVDKVKAILRSAHPNLIAALQNGSLRIHRAWKWCKLSKSQQKEEFASYEEERTRRKILREFGGQSQASFDQRQILEALQLFETRHPGQIMIRRSAKQGTVVILGQDLVEEIKATEDANPHD
jgi:hypothetical protein